MVHGDVEAQAAVPVRVHSECHTGDVLGSLALRLPRPAGGRPALRGLPGARAPSSTCARRAGASACSTRSRPIGSRSSAWIPWKPTSTWASPTRPGTTRWRPRSSDLLGIESIGCSPTTPTRSTSSGRGSRRGGPDPPRHPAQPPRRGIPGGQAREDGPSPLSRNAALQSRCASIITVAVDPWADLVLGRSLTGKRSG